MLFRCSPVPLLASCVLSVDFLVSNPITVMILFYILVYIPPKLDEGFITDVCKVRWSSGHQKLSTQSFSRPSLVI